ncbi:MAG: LuxR family transcriptional regulator, partial [Bacillota bacterium]
MTNDIQLYQSILKSWEICSQKGLSKELGKPLIKLKADEIKKISGKKKDKIEKFSDFMYRHLDTLKNIKNAFCFLLFDEDGYLLSIKHRPGTVEKRYEYKDFFVPGVSFSEESIGTNSVSMAMLLKRSI